MDYYEDPGVKARDTSRAAASAIKPSVKRLQEMCLEALRQYGPLTADQCADLLLVDRLSIRPRFSELARQFRIANTGTRRPNESGKSAIVWDRIV